MGRGKGHTPLRTCISCGEKGIKKDLIRLALNEKDQIVEDMGGTMKGRGAYICKRVSCRELLAKNTRLNRIFRCDRPLHLSSGYIEENHM